LQALKLTLRTKNLNYLASKLIEGVGALKRFGEAIGRARAALLNTKLYIALSWTNNSG
jgi:hypothetical protein